MRYKNANYEWTPWNCSTERYGSEIETLLELSSVLSFWCVPKNEGWTDLDSRSYEGFVFDAKSRPSAPNPNPYPNPTPMAVVSAGLLCLVRLQVGSAGVDAELGKTLGWLGMLWLGKTQVD